MSFQTCVAFFLEHQRTSKDIGVSQNKQCTTKVSMRLKGNIPSLLKLSVRKRPTFYSWSLPLGWSSQISVQMPCRVCAPRLTSLAWCTICELYTSQAEIWEPWSRRCSANILVWLLKHQKTWNILHTYWLIVVLSSVGFFSRFWSSDTRRSAMCLVLCSREESYKDNNMMTIFTFVRTYFKVVNFNQWDLGRRSLNNLFIMSLCYFRLIL